MLLNSFEVQAQTPAQALTLIAAIWITLRACSSGGRPQEMISGSFSWRPPLREQHKELGSSMDLLLHGIESDSITRRQFVFSIR